MQMIPRLIAHNALVKLCCLRILALLPLVSIMALPADDVIRDSVRRLGSIRSEFVAKAVWRILLVASMVGITAQWTIEVEAAVVAGHEWAIDGHLVEIDPDAMVLSVAVEEHAELKQGIGRILDTGNHAAGAEGGLLDITVIVFGVFVEDQSTKLVHLGMSVRFTMVARLSRRGKTYWELIPRPNLGYVKRIKAKLICV